jgi:hypothetical protein
MKKTHVTLIALLMAIAAVFATVALTRTAALGTAGRRAADVAYQARVKQLNAYAASLHRVALRATAAPGAPTATRIVYHRPPPIVVVKHTGHGDDGSQNAEGGGND